MTTCNCPKSVCFLSGLGAGIILALLTAPRRGVGYEACMRGKEARDVARDAADVVERGRRLRRPLSES